MSPEQRNAQKTFDTLCDNACHFLSRNEPLPATLDAILLGYIGFISIGDIVADEHYKELERHVAACPNAELLMPSVYAAIMDVSTYKAANQAYPKMEKVTAWEKQ